MLVTHAAEDHNLLHCPAHCSTELHLAAFHCPLQEYELPLAACHCLLQEYGLHLAAFHCPLQEYGLQGGLAPPNADLRGASALQPCTLQVRALVPAPDLRVSGVRS